MVVEQPLVGRAKFDSRFSVNTREQVNLIIREYLFSVGFLYYLVVPYNFDTSQLLHSQVRYSVYYTTTICCNKYYWIQLIKCSMKWYPILTAYMQFVESLISYLRFFLLLRNTLPVCTLHSGMKILGGRDKLLNRATVRIKPLEAVLFCLVSY